MFRFKQFAIRQENAAMKVGTDGALLGAWCDVSNCKNILDIGTGTGIIAMMVAQRNPIAKITALELDSNAILDATYNVENCPWSDRIKVKQTSLQEFKPTISFDLIVSNPPFFVNSLKAETESRMKARHTDTLHFSDILVFSNENLSEKGSLSLILPFEQAEKCISAAIDYNLYLSRECVIRPVPHKEPHRKALEFSRVKKKITSENLVIETGKRHDYTKDYIALTKDFYTIM